MPSWIQDPKTGKLIPKAEYRAAVVDAPFIQGDIDAFVSPVDGTVISDRGKLRAHNAKHGVTDKRDYSDNYIANRKAQLDRASQRGLKESRLHDIQRAIADHSRG